MIMASKIVVQIVAEVRKSHCAIPVISLKKIGVPWLREPRFLRPADLEVGFTYGWRCI